MPSIVARFQYKAVDDLKVKLSKWNNYSANRAKADDSQVSNDLLTESDFLHKDSKTLAWNIDGDIDVLEDIKTRNYLNRKGSVWELMFSFEEAFLDEVGLVYKIDFYNMTKRIIPKILIKNNINPSNVDWYSVLHLNTDNKHLHIILFQKEEKFELTKMSKHNIINLRSIVINDLLNNSEFYKEKNKNINEIRKAIGENDLSIAKKRIGFTSAYRKCLNQKLLHLYQDLKDKGRLQYNSINMKEDKEKINEIIEFILGHNSLKYKYEIFYNNLLKYEKLLNKTYGNLNTDYIQNQTDKLYDGIGNEILKNYKVYNGLSFFDNEKLFLKNNIMDFKFKSSAYKDEKTFLKFATNLYRLSILVELNSSQTIKLFNDWKRRSNYEFDTNVFLSFLAKKEFGMFTKEEYFKALRSLGFNHKKYISTKSRDFYKEVEYHKFFNQALNNLMYENEKVEQKILEEKERDLNYE
jgi:hypothetical protein